MEFIHLHYAMQYEPQGIYLYIDGETEEYYIDTDGEIGNGVPMDVWNNLRLMIKLPSYIYSKYEVEWILEDLKEDISKILESYSSDYDHSSNLKGHWNQDLIENLEKKISYSQIEDYQSKWHVWDASDWFQDSDFEITDETIKNFDEIVDSEIERALGENVVLNKKSLIYYLNEKIDEFNEAKKEQE